MLQELVIDHFRKKFKNPTYKEWVELTGIEQTRLFRIRNGAPIKVNELERMINLLGDEGLSISLYLAVCDSNKNMNEYILLLCKA